MDETQQSRASDAAATASRKRRSSILKSQRPPRTPFSELEFHITTPTDTAKSRRVSFSKRTGVAEFITNEATTTWKNFYEEHNKSLESSGNDSVAKAPRQTIGHLGKRLFDQQFEEVEAVDLLTTIDNHALRNVNTSFHNVNFTQQLASLECTGGDTNLLLPQKQFEMSALTDQQSKVFCEDLAISAMGEMSDKIDINFSAVQSIGSKQFNDDLDEIQRDSQRVRGNVVCAGPFSGRNEHSEYIEVDLNSTHFSIKNDISDMSITDTINCPKVKDDSKSNSLNVDKKTSFTSKDWIEDKENIGAYGTSSLIVNPGKERRRTIVYEKDCGNISITQAIPAVIIASNKRNTTVYGTDLGDMSLTQANNLTITEAITRNSENVSITQAIPAAIIVSNKRNTTVYDTDLGDMSLTQANNLSITQAITNSGNISITQAIPAAIIVSNKRNTTVYDTDLGEMSLTQGNNLSITQAIPRNIILPGSSSISPSDNLSITEAVPVAKLLSKSDSKSHAGKEEICLNLSTNNEVVRSHYVQEMHDNAEISYNRKRKLVADSHADELMGNVSRKIDISVVHSINKNEVTDDLDEIEKDFQLQARTSLMNRSSFKIRSDQINKSDIHVNMSLTENIKRHKIQNESLLYPFTDKVQMQNIAVSTSRPSSLTKNLPENDICVNAATKVNLSALDFETKLQANLNTERRRTIVYENDTGNISITQAMPSNIILSNLLQGRNTTVYDTESCDISLTQEHNLSMTQAVPVAKILSIIQGEKSTQRNFADESDILKEIENDIKSNIDNGQRESVNDGLAISKVCNINESKLNDDVDIKIKTSSLQSSMLRSVPIKYGNDLCEILTVSEPYNKTTTEFSNMSLTRNIESDEQDRSVHNVSSKEQIRNLNRPQENLVNVNSYMVPPDCMNVSSERPLLKKSINEKDYVHNNLTIHTAVGEAASLSGESKIEDNILMFDCNAEPRFSNEKDIGNISVTQALPSNIIINNKASEEKDTSVYSTNLDPSLSHANNLSVTQAIPSNVIYPKTSNILSDTDSQFIPGIEMQSKCIILRAEEMANEDNSFGHSKDANMDNRNISYMKSIQNIDVPKQHFQHADNAVSIIGNLTTTDKKHEIDNLDKIGNDFKLETNTTVMNRVSLESIKDVIPINKGKGHDKTCPDVFDMITELQHPKTQNKSLVYSSSVEREMSCDEVKNDFQKTQSVVMNQSVLCEQVYINKNIISMTECNDCTHDLSDIEIENHSELQNNSKINVSGVLNKTSVSKNDSTVDEKIKETERRHTVVYEKDNGNISITQAIPAIISTPHVLQNNNLKIHDSKIDDMSVTKVHNLSITQAIPAASILFSNALDIDKSVNISLEETSLTQYKNRDKSDILKEIENDITFNNINSKIKSPGDGLAVSNESIINKSKMNNLDEMESNVHSGTLYSEPIKDVNDQNTEVDLKEAPGETMNEVTNMTEKIKCVKKQNNSMNRPISITHTNWEHVNRNVYQDCINVSLKMPLFDKSETEINNCPKVHYDSIANENDFDKVASISEKCNEDMVEDSSIKIDHISNMVTGVISTMQGIVPNISAANELQNENAAIYDAEFGDVSMAQDVPDPENVLQIKNVTAYDTDIGDVSMTQEVPPGVQNTSYGDVSMIQPDTEILATTMTVIDDKANMIQEGNSLTQCVADYKSDILKERENNLILNEFVNERKSFSDDLALSNKKSEDESKVCKDLLNKSLPQAHVSISLGTTNSITTRTSQNCCDNNSQAVPTAAVETSLSLDTKRTTNEENDVIHPETTNMDCRDASYVTKETKIVDIIKQQSVHTDNDSKKRKTIFGVDKIEMDDLDEIEKDLRNANINSKIKSPGDGLAVSNESIINKSKMNNLYELESNVHSGTLCSEPIEDINEQNTEVDLKEAPGETMNDVTNNTEKIECVKKQNSSMNRPISITQTNWEHVNKNVYQDCMNVSLKMPLFDKSETEINNCPKVHYDSIANENNFDKVASISEKCNEDMVEDSSIKIDHISNMVTGVISTMQGIVPNASAANELQNENAAIYDADFGDVSMAQNVPDPENVIQIKNATAYDTDIGDVSMTQEVPPGVQNTSYGDVSMIQPDTDLLATTMTVIDDKANMIQEGNSLTQCVADYKSDILKERKNVILNEFVNERTSISDDLALSNKKSQDESKVCKDLLNNSLPQAHVSISLGTTNSITTRTNQNCSDNNSQAVPTAAVETSLSLDTKRTANEENYVIHPETTNIDCRDASYVTKETEIVDIIKQQSVHIDNDSKKRKTIFGVDKIEMDDLDEIEKDLRNARNSVTSKGVILEKNASAEGRDDSRSSSSTAATISFNTSHSFNCSASPASNDKNLMSESSLASVITKINTLPFMGSWECAWDTRSGNIWSFRLLHGRLRLAVRLATTAPGVEAARADTPVADVTLDVTSADEKSVVGDACVRMAAEAMRCVARRGWATATRVPPLLARCAAAARLAARWGRAMYEARLHLAYTLSPDGRLALKVANVALRSVWEVTMRLEVVAGEVGQVGQVGEYPRASDVRVTRVVSDVCVGEEEVRRALAHVPADWGHVPRTLWKIFKHLKNKTRDKELLGL